MKLLEWINKLLDEDTESADAVRELWKTEGIKTKIIIMLAYARAIIDAIRATDGNIKTWATLVWAFYIGSTMGAIIFTLQKIYYWGSKPVTMETKDIVFSIALVVCVLLAHWLGMENEKRGLRVLIRPVEEKSKILDSMNKELIDSYDELLSMAREANERAHEVAEKATQLTERSLSQSDKLEDIAKTAIEQRDAERELNKKLGMGTRKRAPFNSGTVARCKEIDEAVRKGIPKTRAINEAGENHVDVKTYDKWVSAGRPEGI